MSHESVLASLAPKFLAGGELKEYKTLQGGLINATYLVSIHTPSGEQQLVFQLVNTTVFPEPELVMENIRKVTEHLREASPHEKNLELKLTVDGSPFISQESSGLWRAFHYLDGCVAHESVTTSTQAYEAGRAFGAFLRQLEGLRAEELRATIPDFHNTPKRYASLQAAVQENKIGRAEGVKNELAFIETCVPWIHTIEHLLETGTIPTRVTHNDTKISNVLFHKESDKAVCVIDLDTVMPGSVLYDFGDLVRTTLNQSAEDASEESVECRLDLFQELAKGYLKAAGDTLTPVEVKHLVFSAKLITLELAIRFLTDYLDGDCYFHVTRASQNLERARNQLKLVELLIAEEDQMEYIISQIISNTHC